jgi:amino acid transporter
MKKIAKNFPFSLVSILLAAILFYIVIGFGVKQFTNVQLLVNFSGNYLFKLMDLFLIGFITIGALALLGCFIQNLREQ